MSPTRRRWLLAAVAGTVAYLVTLGAIDVVVDPGHATGNTSLYTSMMISLVAGTVAAGLTVKARSARRWIAALLLTLLSVAGIGFMYVSYWYLTLGI